MIVLSTVVFADQHRPLKIEPRMVYGTKERATRRKMTRIYQPYRI
jgi:hypothetical protein